GMIVWHDFNSPTPWVHVRQALEQVPFAEEIEHVEGTEVAFLKKSVVRSPWSVAAGDYGLRTTDYGPEAATEPLRIVWEGGFGALHSLALINREVCGRLAARGHELRLVPTQTVGPDSLRVPVSAQLASLYQRELS